jgi:CcmD family protein
MPNAIFVFAAYTLVWLILVGYVLVLARRQTGLRGEIEELERAVKRERPQADAGR